MDLLWKTLDHLDEFVYAVDLDNYEILFLNERYRNELDITVEECKGKPCYNALWNRTAPCTRCHPEKLSSESYNTFAEYDTSENICFVIKETLLHCDDRNIRLEIAINSDEKNITGDVGTIETAANRIMGESLKEESPDACINSLLLQLGEYFDADRSYVFEKNPDLSNSNTYEWCADGVNAEIDNLQNIPEEVAHPWYDAFNEENAIAVEDVDALATTSPLLYEYLKPQDIQSLVVVPLYKNGEAIGFFGVDNPKSVEIDYALSVILIICRFIASELGRRDLVRELGWMSYTDQLTGFGNRFAFRKLVEMKQDVYGKMGVIYCDAVGLKRINDKEGHDAGDAYLKKICKILRDTFEDSEFFRLGGDELLVVCMGTSKADLDEKTAELSKRLKEECVTVSIGTSYKCGGCDLMESVVKAENRMYKDKAEYYQNVQHDRRGKRSEAQDECGNDVCSK